MNCNRFRELRPQTCVRAHQNIITVSKNTTISSQMQAGKLPPIHPARGLRPNPPPQKKVNGSSLSAEEQFLLFGLRCRKDKTGEEVRLFLREGQQKRSGTRPTGSRSKTCLPQLSVQRTMYQSVSAYKDEILQTARCKYDTAEKIRILHTRAQCLSVEEREMSRVELEAKQDRADYEGSYRDSNPLKNEQKAQDLLVKRLKLKEKEKALLRKIYQVQDTREIEEMQLKEDDERKKHEEEGSQQRPVDPELLLFEYENLMSQNEESNKVLRYYRDEKEKLKKNKVRMEEETQRLVLCIKETHEEKNQVEADLEMRSKIKDSRRIETRAENEQLCEELAKVTESFGRQAFSPVYPLMMLLHFEDCISFSLDLIEDMPAERLCKLQKQIGKHYEVREREEEGLRRQALFEERRQRRMERALSQSVKLTGRKLMPRSQPPKNIRKKEKPVETKKTKEDLYAHFVE